MIFEASADSANFTTDYEVGDIVRELDFVTFSCPEGFYFNGTNEINVYATCHDWGWQYNYDPETFCKGMKNNIPDFSRLSILQWCKNVFFNSCLLSMPSVVYWRPRWYL